jgi:hypothetical protein
MYFFVDKTLTEKSNTLTGFSNNLTDFYPKGGPPHKNPLD